jgi:hypothetical protein
MQWLSRTPRSRVCKAAFFLTLKFGKPFATLRRAGRVSDAGGIASSLIGVAVSGVSLGDELETIAEALNAVGRLVESRVSVDPEASSHAGMLSLVAERLRLVRRVVKGNIGPEALVASHNRRSSVAPGEDNDVVLPIRSKRSTNPTRRRRTR